MAKEIVFEELVKTFKLEDGKLYRLFRGVYWKEIEMKDNTGIGYCSVSWNGKVFLAHRLLYSLYHQVDVDTNLVIDHIDGNRIDNSKENLRLVTHDINNRNTGAHREGKLLGCRFHKRDQKWVAFIEINKKQIHLGHFDTEIEANAVHNQALSMLKEGASIEVIQATFNIRTKDKCTSLYKGVSWHKSTNKWQARITVNGKRINLGWFSTEEEAHEVILKAKG